MKLAIMQPYFLPYLGYWQLLFEADAFVIFDVVQYNKRSWMNRNRVLHSDSSKPFQYVKLPIEKMHKGGLIKDALMAEQLDWLSPITGALSVYKRMRAKGFDLTLNLLDEMSAFRHDRRFSKFIGNQIDLVLALFSMNKDVIYASELGFDRSNIQGPGDWALSICQELGATHYVNPCGGAEIFDEEKYLNLGVEIKFLKPNLTPYRQGKREHFEPGLSIIDVLMFNDLEETRWLLSKDYDILKKMELGSNNYD